MGIKEFISKNRRNRSKKMKNYGVKVVGSYIGSSEFASECAPIRRIPEEILFKFFMKGLSVVLHRSIARHHQNPEIYLFFKNHVK